MHGGSLDVTGYTLGAYWTHFWKNGAYLDGSAQVTWNELEMEAGRLRPATTKGMGYALSLEGGYPFDLGKVKLEPQAQLVYQNLSLDSFSDQAATIRYKDLDSLVSRLGVRLVTTGPKAYWLRANLWYEFLGHPHTEVSSEDGYVPFRADLQRLVGQFGGGFTIPVEARMVLYGAANYDTTFNGKGSGYDAKLGIRINW